MALSLIAALLLAPPKTLPVTPTMLVVQYLVPKDGEIDINVPVRSYFVREFLEDSRVAPVSYAMSDPTFRAGVESGALTVPVEAPSDDVLNGLAQKGKFEYVFVVQALKHLDTTYMSGRLLRNKREVWSDRVEIKSSAVQGFSIENAATSTARTWIMKMGEGPFKGLTRNSVGTTPPPLDPIQSPTQPDVQPELPKPVDNSTLRAELDRLLQLGEKRAALMTVRGAVDDEPLDLQRRLWLIELLNAMRLPEEALSESRRAALLFPDAPELRFMVADASIAAGEFEEAASGLLEITVRDPKNEAVRVKLAQVYLYLGKTDVAAEHLKSVADKHVLGHLTRSGLAVQQGDSKRALIEWQAFKTEFANLPSEDQRSASLFCRRFVVHTAEELGADVRDVIQWVRRDPKSKDAQKALQKVQSVSSAIGTWSETIDLELLNPQLKETVVLGLRLLAQASSEAEMHIQKPDVGAADEATITLGEAMRVIGNARKLL